MRPKHPALGLHVEVRDGDGNYVDYERQVRLTR
jgi:hypothetical protein